ncbi:MAG: (Fe-S)-binding protein [Spirochaetota bacterium]|nr:(Fe-S)-binding protein [Spirochaetota bacterium]
MADTKIEVPELKDELNIPRIEENATAHYKCFPAKEDHMLKTGFPGKRVEDWKEKAIIKLGEILKNSQSLKVFMDICVKCGSCTDKCHYFLGTKDPKNMPVARQDLLRKIYKKYFTIAGKLTPGLIGAEELSEDVLDDWYSYFYQCSECRRCSVFCPYGIDTAEVTMAAREIMNAIGVGQKYTIEIIAKVESMGNNLGIPKPALEGTLEVLEEDIKDDTGIDVKIPLDVTGAEVLLIAPSADLFSEPHIYSLMGYAKVFHQAGVSWTLSSYASEFANFGLFIGNIEHMQKIAQRIADQARELNVKRIIVGECGHAWRVAYSFWNTLIGPFDNLDPKYKTPTHICEFTNDLIKRGALKLDKSANDNYTVTMHDSCNVARASRMGDKAGGQFEIPRDLIRASCNKFVEMDTNTTMEKTFCCGGGGGLLSEEIMELRVRGTLPRAQSLKQVMDNDGVNFMAMICAICKAQFSTVLPYYNIDRELVGGVHQLISNAIVVGAKS